MNARYALGLILFALSWLGIQSQSKAEVSGVGLPKIVLEMQRTFDKDGQVVAVMSAGPSRPDANLLVVAAADGAMTVDIEKPKYARWIAENELIVEHGYRASSRVPQSRIVRIDRQGNQLQVLSDNEGLSNPKPNKMGQWAAVRFNEKSGVPEGVAIRGGGSASSFNSFVPFHENAAARMFSHLAWAPDSTHLALAVWEESSFGHGILPRLGILSDGSTPIRRFDAKNSINARPLFWTKVGLFATGKEGMLQCNGKTESCELVYAPGSGRFIFSGTPTDDEHAILLVQDHESDPLEVRGKELHKVNLKTGTREEFMRLPNDVFISDIDIYFQ